MPTEPSQPAGPSDPLTLVGQSLTLAELELANARLAGENDALRAKCSRLSATVDELLARLAHAAPASGRHAKPVAGYEPTCPHCGSADMRYRNDDQVWRCHTCGQVDDVARARPKPSAPAVSCSCATTRADTPDVCLVHGALSPENA